MPAARGIPVPYLREWRLRAFANWPLQKALRLATLNPAHVLGREDIGVFAPGARADLVVLTSNGEVQRTIIGGVI